MLWIFFFVVVTANRVNLGGNCFNYVAVYGNAENWWESSNITAASILILMLLLVFFARELIVERPLLPLGNFKNDSLIKNKKNGNIKIGKLTAA